MKSNLESLESLKFSHFNKDGLPQMVDVGNKADTHRLAIARCSIKMKKETIELIKNKGIKKGDVLSVAQVAGILGAKKTSDIIPMTHNIFLTAVNLKFEVLADEIIIESEVKTFGKTGVEIEALTSVAIAGLTIYDMCKSVDKDMTITNVQLIKKLGGKSGDKK